MAHMRENRNAYRVIAGNGEVKRPHGIPRHSWQDNSKMYRRVGEHGLYSSG